MHARERDGMSHEGEVAKSRSHARALVGREHRSED